MKNLSDRGRCPGTLITRSIERFDCIEITANLKVSIIMPKDYYKILDLKRDANGQQIAIAYYYYN